MITALLIREPTRDGWGIRWGILCTRCGRVSYNPEDVRQRYCGACRRYHQDPVVCVLWAVPDDEAH
jgi:hypothetical protein